MLPDAADGDVVVDGNDGALRLPGTSGAARPWAWATAGFALLWLVTLVWALQRRPQAAPQRDGRAEPSKAGTGLRDLKRVLDSGDFGEVAAVLCAMADPPAADPAAMPARPAAAPRRAAVRSDNRREGK